MTLAEIIRNRQFRKPVPAIPATVATLATVSGIFTPSVAAVAVASLASEVLACATTEAGCDDIAIEPASSTARPIYWETMDGAWHGPVKPEYLGRTGSGENEVFWVIVTHNGIMRWIWSDLLRSRQAFQNQKR
jgi:hypothetical protein